MSIQFQSIRPMAAPAAANPSARPSVRFAGQDEPTSETFERTGVSMETLPKPSIGERLKYAGQLALKYGFNKEGLLRDTKWALAICIATCWLPGSQLMTVPINYGIFITVRMLQGIWTGWTKAPLLKQLEALSAKGQ